MCVSISKCVLELGASVIYIDTSNALDPPSILEAIGRKHMHNMRVVRVYDIHALFDVVRNIERGILEVFLYSCMSTKFN